MARRRISSGITERPKELLYGCSAAGIGMVSQRSTRRGGSLVTGKVDDALVPDAETILKRSNWVDPAEWRVVYNEQGWAEFGDTLDPYGSEQIEQERDRHRCAGL